MIQTEAISTAPAPDPITSIPPSDTAREVVIRPTPGWRAVNWAEMYEFRELLARLIWRDIAVRYKQSVLGPAWAIIQPTIMVVIFTLANTLLSVPMPSNVPKPLVIFAGLILWTIFAQGMPAAAGSMVSAASMVTKIYFPRLFLPIAAAAVLLVDGVLTLPLFGLMLLYYGIAPAWTIVFTPVFFLLTLLASLGMGVFLAALTVFYRDFKHVVPFVVQIMTYVSPVFFTSDIIPSRWRPLASLNPMFGIMEGYRSATLGLPMQWDCLLISSAVTLVLFFFAVHYFRRTERLFADYV